MPANCPRLAKRLHCSARRNGSLHHNFMGYTTHADADLVRFGVSAISRIADAYAQNPRALPDWDAVIDAGRRPVWRGLVLDEDDLLRADLIQDLMCQGTVAFVELGRRYGVDAHRLLMCVVAACFDRYSVW